MENTQAKIQDILPKEEIEEMMYEEDRQWNMEEIMDCNDEFSIELEGETIEFLKMK